MIYIFNVLKWKSKKSGLGRFILSSGFTPGLKPPPEWPENVRSISTLSRFQVKASWYTYTKLTRINLPARMPEIRPAVYFFFATILPYFSLRQKPMSIFNNLVINRWTNKIIFIPIRKRSNQNLILKQNNGIVRSVNYKSTTRETGFFFKSVWLFCVKDWLFGS